MGSGKSREPPAGSHSRMVQGVVITGMSGSGKSTALKAFEDLGYFCVDNLPIVLLPEFLYLTEGTSSMPVRVALVMDVREGTFLDQFRSIFSQIRQEGFHLEVLFLDASDDVLIRRFSQTRRRHPLLPRGNVSEGIRSERSQLRGIREFSDRLLDTSDFNVHQLRWAIHTIYAHRERLDRLVVHVMSFGFKYGVPADANLVLDVRFLPNPYFEPGMTHMSGKDEPVIHYVLDHDDTREFLQRAQDLLDYLVPRYQGEGKSYLVIAVGCTGGRHRSVAIAEYLGRVFTEKGLEVIVTHRDMDREG